MPGEKSIHTAKWDRCVKKVKEKSPDANPYAICSSSIDDGGVKKSHQKKSGDGYYSNRKKAAAKKEMMTTKFTDFVNEWHSEYRSEQEEHEWSKVKQLVDKFIEEHPKPFDLIMNGVVTEENGIGDYIADWLQDQELDGKSVPGVYFRPVMEEIQKIKPEFAQLWMEF